MSRPLLVTLELQHSSSVQKMAEGELNVDSLISRLLEGEFKLTGCLINTKLFDILYINDGVSGCLSHLIVFICECVGLRV